MATEKKIETVIRFLFGLDWIKLLLSCIEEKYFIWRTVIRISVSNSQV